MVDALLTDSTREYAQSGRGAAGDHLVLTDTLIFALAGCSSMRGTSALLGPACGKCSRSADERGCSWTAVDHSSAVVAAAAQGDA